MGTDLELVSTRALVEELERRTDTCVVVFARQVRPQAVNVEVHCGGAAGKNLLHALGLMTRGQQFIHETMERGG